MTYIYVTYFCRHKYQLLLWLIRVLNCDVWIYENMLVILFEFLVQYLHFYYENCTVHTPLKFLGNFYSEITQYGKGIKHIYWYMWCDDKRNLSSPNQTFYLDRINQDSYILEYYPHVFVTRKRRFSIQQLDGLYTCTSAA